MPLAGVFRRGWRWRREPGPRREVECARTQFLRPFRADQVQLCRPWASHGVQQRHPAGVRAVVRATQVLGSRMMSSERA